MNNIPVKRPAVNNDALAKFTAGAYLPLLIILLVELAAYSGLFTIFFLSDDFNLLLGSSKWMTPGAEYFRPIPHLLINCCYKIFGLSLFPYHLLSFLVHYVNAVILYLIIKKIVGSSYFALAGSILFVCSYLASEAVSWISAITSLAVALFYLLAVYSYMNFLETLKKRYYTGALICFTAALLSKENAVTLPVILLLIGFLDICSRAECKKKFLVSLKRAAPFFLIAFIYLGVKVASLTTALADSTLSLGYHNLRNIRHLLLSLCTFNPFYDLPFIFLDLKILGLFSIAPAAPPVLQIDGKFISTLAVGSLLLILGLILIIKGSKKIKVAFLAFIVSLGPFIFISSHHIPFGGHFLYPLRLYYLPGAMFFIFFTLIFSEGIGWLLKRIKSPKPVYLAAILLVIAVAFSDVVKIRKRNADWVTAGNIARSVLVQLEPFINRAPQVEKIVLFNLPDSYRGAYILRNGIHSAVKLYYPHSGVNLEVIKTAPRDYKIPADKPQPGNTIFIDCAAAKLTRLFINN